MTIQEWKEEFERLYKKAKVDIGADSMDVFIYEEKNNITPCISTSEIKININL